MLCGSRHSSLLVKYKDVFKCILTFSWLPVSIVCINMARIQHMLSCCLCRHSNERMITFHD